MNPNLSPSNENAGAGGQTPPLEDLLEPVDFRPPQRPHITVDQRVCRSCTARPCVNSCPARLFVPTADGGLLFDHSQCFECGTCYQVCPGEGAIYWTYPDGGLGVVLRKG